MGKGRDYENFLVNAIDRVTADEVNVYPVGYSGSHEANACDIVVADGRTGMNHAIEAKKTGQDTLYIEPEQLAGLVETTNAMTHAYLVVSFNNREVMTTRYFNSLTEQQHPDAAKYNALSVAEKFAVLIPDAFNPRATPSGKLALDKPALDDWPSAKGGSPDEHAVCSGLGITTAESVEVTD